jgi:hypothetical protein
MKILSFIEDPEIVKKILKHLGLWDLKPRPPPKARASSPNIHIDYVYFKKSRKDSQLPPSDDYLYVDVEYPEAISA